MAYSKQRVIRTIYRGYDVVREEDGHWRVYQNAELVGDFDTEERACGNIDEVKRGRRSWPVLWEDWN